MAQERPAPAENCAACAYFALPASRCRRRAPVPGHEEFELVFWSVVAPSDRCGDSAAIGDGSGSGVVRCHTCRDWFQPEGEGIKPDYRHGLTVQWWAESGYCTRAAPAPSSDDDRRARWKVTHKDDGCGDGEAVQISVIANES